MSSNQVIFINNRNTVDTYSVRFSSQLESIQKRIDEWHGRGEIRTKEGYSLKPSNPRNRIQIVDFERLACINGFGCYSDFAGLNYYKYYYYEYEPHPLSLICDKLLKSEDFIEVSKNLKQLLEWRTDEEEEKGLLKDLLHSITFEKLELTRINYLRRICMSLKIKQQLRVINSDDKNKSKLLESIPTIENVSRVA
jgi:hypothetical protein